MNSFNGNLGLQTFLYVHRITTPMLLVLVVLRLRGETNNEWCRGSLLLSVEFSLKSLHMEGKNSVL